MSHSSLIRLRQIAEELRAAAQRNDLEVVRAAAKLLQPTWEHCKQVWDGGGDTVRAALQARDLLDETEAILASTMRDVASDMKRIRQGKRSIAMARARTPARPVRILNPIR